MTRRDEHQITAHIGARIRKRRHELGQSGREIAEKVGVTLQQVSKYEIGADRISAGLVFLFARALGVPVTYFFDGLDHQPASLNQRHRLLLEFMRHLSNIPSRKHVEAVGQIVRLLLGKS